MSKQPLHIVHIVPSLSFGGAERCVVDIVNNCDPTRFRFSIAVFFNIVPLAPEVNGSVKITLLERSNPLWLGHTAKIVRYLKAVRADIVHTHLFSPEVWGRWAARRAGLPVVTTEHNINIDQGWLKGRIKRALRGISDIYVATSAAIAADMETRYHIPRREVTVIRCAVAAERFAAPTPPLVHPFRLLMVGRLAYQKGHTIALEALAGVIDYPWALTIVGNGELRQHISAEIKRLNLEERVTLRPATRQVAALYAEHDMVLVPSRWEGLGIVAMEAMAAGRVVVAMRTGGLPEIITDNETGFLVASPDSAAWQDQLRYCFDNAEHCARVAQAGEQFVRERCTIGEMAKAYEKLYQNMI